MNSIVSVASLKLKVIQCCPLVQVESTFFIENLETYFRVWSNRFFTFEHKLSSAIQGCCIYSPSQNASHIYWKPWVSLDSSVAINFLVIVSKKFGTRCLTYFSFFKVLSSGFFAIDWSTTPTLFSLVNVERLLRFPKVGLESVLLVQFAS
jgi:hypothetical protein